ncbi:MAG: glutathione S-transferase family protein [Pseudolabrys sp.]|nr:glutathione S-transferase family protein [Pseudolabrys sp.]MDP2294310.1 glutathione S-transferase family protein [Pseudolabrys sp.]
MSMTLYFHPLSSFCHKALTALYENDTPFTPHVVDLGDPASNAAFKKVWPVGKFPVLRDEASNRLIPESTSIIEYLSLHYPGRIKLVPDDAELAAAVRETDRFYDLNVHVPMQKIITDRIRPAGKNDTFGVDQARELLHTALGIAEKKMASRPWATGALFTMADCAAAPTLFYTDMAIMPLAGAYPHLAGYLGRIKDRSSYGRVLKEAEPYLHWVPREKV